MPLSSMTGYASEAGAAAGIDWQWEARSVNSRGLDLRIRLPEGLESLEPEVRRAAGARLSRGSVTVTLRAQLGEDRAAGRLSETGLAEVLALARRLRDAAEAAGLDLAPLSVGDLLSNRAVFETERVPERLATVAEAVGAGVPALLDALGAARAGEGRALGDVIAGQLATLERLAGEARAAAAARAADQRALLAERVAALLAATDRVDEDRLAQELALLAVKADVTEELDRLAAHVAAARELLAAEGPVGRKLDFLCQELAREANTLCSKSGSAPLTAVGLEMKVVVDQLREQCQNVE